MLDDKVHNILFSDATLKLGEIHWTLPKSVSAIESSLLL